MLTLPATAISSLHIILTYKCNYRCTFCFQPDFHSTLNPVVWREKLLPLYPQLRDIVLHGGEPTAVSSFREFVALIMNCNDSAKFKMFTNGRLFEGFWLDLMLTRGSVVNFSLNAAHEETYDLLHRFGKRSAVLANLRRAVKERERRNSSLRIETSIVVTDANISELPEFVALSAREGCDRVSIFLDLDLLPRDRKASADSVDRALDVAERLAITVWGLENLRGKLLGLPVGAEFLESWRCRRTLHNLYVNVRADVSFCNFLEPHPIGNLLENSIEDIWNSSIARGQRNSQLTGDWTWCRSAYCGPSRDEPERVEPMPEPMSTPVRLSPSRGD